MSLQERGLTDAARRTRIKGWSCAALAGLALAEIVLPRLFGGGEAHFAFERLPAWGSLYGLASCVGIIVVSKLLGKLWLTRREGFYDD